MTMSISRNHSKVSMFVVVGINLVASEALFLVKIKMTLFEAL